MWQFLAGALGVDFGRGGPFGSVSCTNWISVVSVACLLDYSDFPLFRGWRNPEYSPARFDLRRRALTDANARSALEQVNSESPWIDGFVDPLA